MPWDGSSRRGSRPARPAGGDRNRGGAGGAIGGDVVAKSAPDGYTVMLDASNHAQNPALRKMPFDTLRDRAVSLLVKVPNVLVVTPSAPFRTVQDVVAQAKAKPGGINYASSGNGSAQHLAGELFASTARSDMVHVAYKGGGPALTDVMAGQVPMFFASLASSLPFIQSGRCARWPSPAAAGPPCSRAAYGGRGRRAGATRSTSGTRSSRPPARRRPSSSACQGAPPPRCTARKLRAARSTRRRGGRFHPG